MLLHASEKDSMSAAEKRMSPLRKQSVFVFYILISSLCDVWHRSTPCAYNQSTDNVVIHVVACILTSIRKHSSSATCNDNKNLFWMPSSNDHRKMTLQSMSTYQEKIITRYNVVCLSDRMFRWILQVEEWKSKRHVRKADDENVISEKICCSWMYWTSQEANQSIMGRV